MPKTLGLLIAVLIIALLGALAVTLNDRAGFGFYLNGQLQGDSESLDIWAGNGIEVTADSSPDQTDYTISTHLGVQIGETPIDHADGGNAVADTLAFDSTDESLKIDGVHSVGTNGENVVTYNFTEAAVEIQAEGTPVAESTATPPVPIRRPAINFIEDDGIILTLADAPDPDGDADTDDDRIDITVTLDGLEFYEYDDVTVTSTQIQDTTPADVRFDQFELRGGTNVTIDTATYTTDDKVVYEVSSSAATGIEFASEDSATPTFVAGDSLNVYAGDGITVNYTEPPSVSEQATYEIVSDGIVMRLDGAAQTGDLTSATSFLSLDLNEGAGVIIDFNESSDGVGTYTLTAEAGSIDLHQGTSTTVDDATDLNIEGGTNITVDLDATGTYPTYTVSASSGITGNINFSKNDLTGYPRPGLNVTEGDGIAVTFVEGGLTESADYELSIEQLDLDRTTLTAGTGMTVTAGTPDVTTGAIEYEVSDPKISFWIDGSDTNADRGGLDLIGGTDIAISQTTHGDRVAYTLDFDGTSGSPEFTGSPDAIDAPDTVNIEGVGAIDVTLNENPTGTARYRISLDQSYIDRDTVVAGDNITVTSGTPDATTDAIEYEISNPTIDFFLNGTDIGNDRGGIDLVGGANVTITQTTHDDRVAFSIAATTSGAGDITFDSGGQTTVAASEVNIDASTGSGIDITLSAVSGVATYAFAVDESDLDRTSVTGGSGITVTAGNANSEGVIDYSVAIDTSVVEQAIVSAGNAIDVTDTTASGVTTYTVAVDESDIDRTTLTASTSITLTGGTPAADGSRAYTVAVKESAIDRTTVTAGTGITVTGGTPAADGSRAYTVADTSDTISFFLNGADTGNDRAGIDLVPGTDITISQTTHNDRVAYTLNSTAVAGDATTYQTDGSGNDVEAATVSLNEGDGIDITLSDSSGDAHYLLAVDQSDLDRTTVTGGSSITVTAGNANSEGVIDYSVAFDTSGIEQAIVSAGNAIDVTDTTASGVTTYTVAVDESDIDRTTLTAGDGITLTGGTPAADGSRAYTIEDEGDDISFFLGGTDTGEDRDGLDLIAGTDITITQVANTDRVSYTVNSTASGSSEVDYQTDGTGADLSAGEMAINEGNAIAVALTNSSGVASFEVGVAEDELDRTTVVAGDGVTVTAGTADATTGAIEYTVADDGDAITFRAAGTSDVDRPILKLTQGHAVQVVLTNTTDEAVYSIGVRENILAKTIVEAGDGIEVASSFNNILAQSTYTISDPNDEISFFENGASIDDKEGLDITAGDGLEITTQSHSNRVQYTIAESEPDEITFYDTAGSTLATEPGLQIKAGTNVTIATDTSTSDRVIYTINASGSGGGGGSSDITFASGSQDIVDASEVDITSDSDSGITVTLTDETDVATYALSVDTSDFLDELTEAEVTSDTDDTFGLVSGERLEESVNAFQNFSPDVLRSVAHLPADKEDAVLYLPHDFTQGDQSNQTVTAAHDSQGRVGYSSGVVVEAFGSLESGDNLAGLTSIYGYGADTSNYTIEIVHSTNEHWLDSVDLIEINGTVYDLGDLYYQYGIPTKEITSHPTGLSTTTLHLNFQYTGGDDWTYTDSGTGRDEAGLYSWRDDIDLYVRLQGAPTWLEHLVWNGKSDLVTATQKNWYDTDVTLTSLGAFPYVRVESDGFYQDILVSEITALTADTAATTLGSGTYRSVMFHKFDATTDGERTKWMYLGKDADSLLVAFTDTLANIAPGIKIFGLD